MLFNCFPASVVSDEVNGLSNCSSVSNGSFFSGCFQHFLLFFGFQQLCPSRVLCFYCLGFTGLLENVNLCLPSNLGNFETLFLQTLVITVAVSILLVGCQAYTYQSFYIVWQDPDIAFIFVINLSLCPSDWLTLLIYLQVHWLSIYPIKPIK